MPLFFVIISALLTTCLIGQDLIVSDFSGPDPASNLPVDATTQLAPNFTTTGWDLGPEISAFATVPDRLAFFVTAPGDPALTSLADAIAEEEYLTLSLSSADPINLGGMRLSYTIQRDSWFAPRQYSVLTSADGFTNAVQTSELLANADQTAEEFTFIFPLTGFDNLASPVEIRLYPHAARYNNHPVSLNAFSITDPGPTFSLSASAGQNGTANASPDSSLFTAGEIVTITAIPPAGHRFAGWSGTTTGNFNPLQIIVSQNETITANFVPNLTDTMLLSTNLPQIAYWSTATPFTDLMKNGGGWVPIEGGNPPALDALGYPLEIPYDNGAGVMTSVRSSLPNFVAGDHTITFDGTGVLRFSGPAVVNQIFTESGTLSVIDPQENLVLNLLVSDPADPIRNLRIHLPGFDETTTFHPDYLEDLAPYSALRFMDWGQTNANPITSWSEVPTADHCSQGRTAVLVASYELMIELANLTQQDPWICVPHLVDDFYVTQLATLLSENLDPTLQIYLEYSNETWNGAPGFWQTYYTRDQGIALGLSANDVEAGQLFTAMRSAQIWQIFRDTFTDPDRIINVMPSWATNPLVSELRMQALADPAINPSGITADALAIAPYFGNGIQQAELDATGYPTIESLVTTRSIDAIANDRLDVQAQKAIANHHGVLLICYEGGQHWSVPSNLSNDTTLVSLLSAVNRDQRMYDRYLEYLDMLREEGVANFFNFQLTGPHSRFGFFGVYEFQNQNLTDAPKARALIDWGNSNSLDSSLTFDWQSNTVSMPLLPGRRYTLQSSSDLTNWLPHPMLEDQWGEHSRLSLPISDEFSRQFWRLQTE